MAKGKTNQPLNILVIDPTLYDSEAIKKLIDQGHNVSYDTGMEHYDRVYGPNCYRMTKDLLPFLPVSLKTARLEKRGRKA